MTLLEKLSSQDFTLSLSSGFFGFFSHCGFVKALESEGLKPKRITGSSAGSIVAACLASGLNPFDMEKEFLNLTKQHYWDPAFGIGFLKGQVFEKTLHQFVKHEMKDASIPLHIATFDIARRRTQVFTEGPLPRIIRASCAVPMMFHPVKINNRYYWDGGLQDKMGWSQISSDELILGHSLPSDAISALFEDRRYKKNPNRFVLNTKGLPPTGPGQFANAPKSISMTYEQTKKFLDTKL